MPVTEPPLIAYEQPRSELEQHILAFARTLETQGFAKDVIIYGMRQTLLDLCLDDDDVPVMERIEVMRHTGRTLLAVVEQIEDRMGAIERYILPGCRTRAGTKRFDD